MSAQPSPTVVVSGSRVRNENASPFKKGIGDILFGAGSLLVGGVAGYFVADYVVKNDIIAKMMDKIGLSPAVEEDTKPAGDVNTGDDEAANLAYITPLWPEVTDTGDTFDRTTRQVTGMAGKKAYITKTGALRARVFTKFYDPPITENAGEFNQIVTDDKVYQE